MMRSAWNGPRSLIAHHHAAAVGQVGDARVARDRQRRVRRGHRVHVVGLAAGGLLAVEAPAVPAADAALPERRATARERHVVPAEHLVGTVGEAVQRLGLAAPRRESRRGSAAGCRPGRRPCSSRPWRAPAAAAVGASAETSATATAAASANASSLTPRTPRCRRRWSCARARRARSRGTACSCPGSSAPRARRASAACGSKSARSRGRARLDAARGARRGCAPARR